VPSALAVTQFVATQFGGNWVTPAVILPALS
jgi:hypothetical protein